MSLQPRRSCATKNERKSLKAPKTTQSCFLVEVPHIQTVPEGVWPQGRVIRSKPVRGNVRELIMTDPTDLQLSASQLNAWKMSRPWLKWSTVKKAWIHSPLPNEQPNEALTGLLSPTVPLFTQWLAVTGRGTAQWRREDPPKCERSAWVFLLLTSALLRV